MWTRDCKLFSTCLYRMWFSLPVATILSVFFMVSSSELIIFFMVFSSEQVFLIQSPVGADASGWDVLSHAPELVAVTRCLAHGVPECFLVGGPLRSLGWAFPLPPRPARALRSPSVPSRPVPSHPVPSHPVPSLPSPPLPSPPLLCCLPRPLPALISPLGPLSHRLQALVLVSLLRWDRHSALPRGLPWAACWMKRIPFSRCRDGPSLQIPVPGVPRDAVTISVLTCFPF